MPECAALQGGCYQEWLSTEYGPIHACGDVLYKYGKHV